MLYRTYAEAAAAAEDDDMPGEEEEEEEEEAAVPGIEAMAARLARVNQMAGGADD